MTRSLRYSLAILAAVGLFAGCTIEPTCVEPDANLGLVDRVVYSRGDPLEEITCSTSIGGTVLSSKTQSVDRGGMDRDTLRLTPEFLQSKGVTMDRLGQTLEAACGYEHARSASNFRVRLTLADRNVSVLGPIDNGDMRLDSTNGSPLTTKRIAVDMPRVCKKK